ncbi:hypothetical protein ACQP1W_00820 [Spirillospora sp. CA-255316]
MKQKVASYEPTGNHPEWPRVAPVVCSTVITAAPQTSRKVLELMRALSRLALFVEAENAKRAQEAEQVRWVHEARRSTKGGNSTGLACADKRTKPNSAEWLSIGTIDRFIQYGLPGTTTATRDSYRRTLLRLRAAVFGEGSGKPLKLSDSNPHRPYTRAEQTEMWYWAHNQPTTRREAACKVLLCLGLGCGLESAEICQVRAHDVRVARNGAVTVHVRGPRPRAVKCRRAWELALAELVAGLSGQATWLFQPTVGRRSTSLVSSLVSRARKAPDSPAVNVRRMRSTWLIDLIENRVALDTIAAAAGLDSLDPLSPVLPFIASSDPAEAERQLRGMEP